MLKHVANLIAAFIVSAVIGTVLLLASSVLGHCDERDGLELQEVSLHYKRFWDGGRDPLVTQNGLDGRAMDKELNLDINVDILRYFYWNNTVHSMTDRTIDGGNGQFRVIGWNYKLGARIFPSFHIQYEHFSQHLLDTTYAHGGFPVQDSVGFVLYIYSSSSPKSIF